MDEIEDVIFPASNVMDGINENFNRIAQSKILAGTLIERGAESKQSAFIPL